MSFSGDALKSLALQASLSPQEEMLETSHVQRKYLSEDGKSNKIKAYKYSALNT